MSAERLVFVGGGHAHLYSLVRAAHFIRQGVEVVLIGPDRYHYYSGMGPGLLSRIYRPEQVRFDVERLVETRGGAYIQGKVASIDPDRRSLKLESGETVDYDRVSFNTGSRVPLERIPGAEGIAMPVKPIENMERARRGILEKAETGEPKVLIVGAGPAGVELAGNTWRLLRDRGARATITLTDAADRVLPGFPSKASRLAHGSLTRRGVRIVTEFRTASVDEGVARADTGEEIPYDLLLVAIGIVPHRIYAQSGLPTADDGALEVNEFLQSTGHPEVFGGGDCVSIRGRPLSRVGVYAVRQAPVLFRNLMASLRGEALEPFKPQHRYLLVLNLGDQSGLVIWGRWVLRGRWAFRWKNYLDTSFMAKYQVSGEAP